MINFRYYTESENKQTRNIEGAGRRLGNNRVRWGEQEKKLAITLFDRHIKKKIAPNKQECEEILWKYSKVFVNKDWLKLKTFVYNCYRLKN